MNVLIISQPVLSETNNMGKTLMGYFSSFSSSEVAQLYLRNGTPDSFERCNRYYRFSDEDAVRSVFFRKTTGKRFDISKTGYGCGQPQSVSKVYKVGSKHRAWMLLLRDLIWRVSSWKNACLLEWIAEVEPDVIFFAAGDGMFSYRIADYLSHLIDIPLVIVCMDDFFLNNRNKGEFLGNIRQVLFMQTVKKTVRNAAAVFTICDSMNKVYSQLFNISCYTLYTPAVNRKLVFKNNAKQLSYIGNIGCGRYKLLLEVGKVLSEIGDSRLPKCLDVYTGSYQPEYVEPLREAPGICFHGSISSDEVLNVMSKSVAVMHVESFEEKYKALVRFSVSTKIAESLMYGPCLIAYGPKGIASIDYLEDYGAAYVIADPNDLKKGLKEVLTNRSLRERTVRNARAVAKRNHNSDINPKRVRELLEQIVEQYNTRKLY